MALANMTQEKTNQANRDHCKSIADTLDLIANGQLYKCPECGEYVNIEDHAENEDLYDAIFLGNTCTCPECDNEAEFEQVSMYDWLEGALDFDYIIGSDRQYKACRVVVACGGPNIYVDTLRGSVDLYWWADRASYDLSRATCEALDEAMQELFEC